MKSRWHHYATYILIGWLSGCAINEFKANDWPEFLLSLTGVLVWARVAYIQHQIRKIE